MKTIDNVTRDDLRRLRGDTRQPARVTEAALFALDPCSAADPAEEAAALKICADALNAEAAS